MNILTDEEIATTLKLPFESFRKAQATEDARAIEAAVLAKLAAHDVEPIYQLCKADSSFSSAWIDVDEQTYSDAGLYPEYGRRRLYTEAQYLAAQQRTAEACAKVCAKRSDALREPACLGDATAIRNGEWRNYK